MWTEGSYPSSAGTGRSLSTFLSRAEKSKRVGRRSSMPCSRALVWVSSRTWLQWPGQQALCPSSPIRTCCGPGSSTPTKKEPTPLSPSALCLLKEDLLKRHLVWLWGAAGDGVSPPGPQRELHYWQKLNGMLKRFMCETMILQQKCPGEICGSGYELFQTYQCFYLKLPLKPYSSCLFNPYY